VRAEVYPSPDGWRFRVKANNNEIMCTGEAYVRRIDAESALRQLFTNGPLDVTVRNHGNEIVEHYPLGRSEHEGSLDDIYTGPMEDTTQAFFGEEDEEGEREP